MEGNFTKSLWSPEKGGNDSFVRNLVATYQRNRRAAEKWSRSIELDIDVFLAAGVRRNPKRY